MGWNGSIGGVVSEFLHLVATAITVLFLIGLAGSTLVLLITFGEDLLTISGHEERKLRREEQQRFNANAMPTSSAR